MADDAFYNNLVAEFERAEETLVDCERRGELAIVTLDDPERFNCLSGALTVQLRRVLEQLVADTGIRSIILTGRDPAFSAGGDVALMQKGHKSLEPGSEQGATVMRQWIRYQFGTIARLIRGSEKLFIAAVNGAAAGVGLAFVLAADIIVASDRARLVPAFGRIGLIPEVGTNWLLAHRLGHQRAMEFYLSGDEITASQALSLGLVNRLVTHESLLAEAESYAEKAAGLPPHLVAMTKTLLHRAADISWEQSVELEEFAEPLCFTTGFHQRAVQRFLRKQT